MSSVPAAAIRAPEALRVRRAAVHFSVAALIDVACRFGAAPPFGTTRRPTHASDASPSAVVAAVSESLSLDPRSVHSVHLHPEGVFAFCAFGMEVVFQYREGDVAVLRCLSPVAGTRPRTRAWLSGVRRRIPPLADLATQDTE
eukprot:Polyplicarium_translucidae@DN2125_c0_g1_i3.p2